MISIFFIASVACLLYPAIGKPDSRVVTGICAIVAIAAAGLRIGGFDYEEYLIIIDALRDTFEQDTEFSLRLLIAKDPMMLALSDLGQYLSMDPYKFVFVGFAILGLAPKAVASFTLKEIGPVFFGCYLIFLSPGLEFAAIRAGAAVAFFMLAAALRGKIKSQGVLCLLSAASHLSLIFFILALPFAQRLKAVRPATVTVVVVAMVSYLLSSLLGEFERGEDFSANAGTINALLFPVFTCAIFAIQLLATDAGRARLHGIVAPNLGMALGLALPSITVSFRILEICWCLMLFSLFQDTRDKRWTDANAKFLCFGMFFVMATFSALKRSGWSSMLFDISY